MWSSKINQANSGKVAVHQGEVPRSKNVDGEGKSPISSTRLRLQSIIVDNRKQRKNARKNKRRKSRDRPIQTLQIS